MASYTRCMWYDDNKQPASAGNGTGCRNRNCLFIHPDDPEWPHARRGKIAEDRHPISSVAMEDKLKRLQQEKERASIRKDHAVANDPRRRPTPTDVENPGGSSLTPSSTNPSSTGGFQPQSAPAKQPSTNLWGGDGVGWGGGDGPSLWNPVPEASGSGKGSNWAESSKTATATTPTTLTSGSWGDVSKPNSSTLQQKPGPATATSSLPALPSVPSSSSSNLGKPPLPTPARKPTLTAEKGNMGPPPLPKPSQKVQEGTASKGKAVARESSHATPTPSRASSVQRSEAGGTSRTRQPAAPTAPMKPPTTAAERRELYRNVIKTLVILVSITVQHNEKNNEYQRWKKAANNAHYGQSSQEARKILDQTYCALSGQVHSLGKEKRKYLDTLLAYPDLPAKARVYDLEGDKKKLLDYTVALKKWLLDVGLPERLKGLQPPQTDAQGDVVMDDGDEVPGRTSPHPETWASPQLRLENLRERAEAVENGIGMNLEQNVNDYLNAHSKKFQDVIDAFNAKCERRQVQEASTLVAAQKENFAALGMEIETTANTLAPIGEQLVKVEEWVEQHEAQIAKLRAANDQDEQIIKDLEAQQQANEAKIERVTQLLHQAAKSRRSPGAPRTVREITIDDIAPEVRQELVNRLTTELKPILQSVVDSTQKSTEQVRELILKKLDDTIVAKNESIVAKARAIRSAQAQAFSPTVS